MSEPSEWALRKAHELFYEWNLPPLKETRSVWLARGERMAALVFDAARRQGIEEAAASHEHNGGNPVFRKMEADAIRALADKRP